MHICNVQQANGLLQLQPVGVAPAVTATTANATADTTTATLLLLLLLLLLAPPAQLREHDRMYRGFI
jgi:hypothetical protein